MLNKWLANGEIPADCSNSLVLIIYKERERDKEDPENYQKSVPYPNHNRLTQKFDFNQPLEQASFQKGHITVEIII